MTRVSTLFVYGTLAPRRPNEHVLGDVPGTWEPATVRGDLVEAGWGAAAGYPALVLRDDGADVRGFLFSSAALDEQWQVLDDFEGPGYQRVQARVTRVGVRPVVDAWVYVHREVAPADGNT